MNIRRFKTKSKIKAKRAFGVNRLSVLFWRLWGCDHNGQFCLDVGDPGEHFSWHCFRCDSKL